MCVIQNHLSVLYRYHLPLTHPPGVDSSLLNALSGLQPLGNFDARHIPWCKGTWARVQMCNYIFVHCKAFGYSIGLPLALRYLPSRYVHVSSYTTLANRCLALCVGSSAQKFCGKEESNVQRRNRVRAAYVAFLLRALQAGFGCATVLNTLEETYSLPSIVLCCHHLASFAEVH